MTSPQMERKREHSIGKQVAHMMARRALEQAKLAELLEDIDTRLASLNERRLEVLSMMGVTAPVAATEPEADPLKVKCADCGGGVELTAPGALPSECPHCTASPFEVMR